MTVFDYGHDILQEQDMKKTDKGCEETIPLLV
jgi:hypothetical protein